jgi:hypothetical protein
MKLELEIDDDLSTEEGLVYLMVGDMFDVVVEIHDTRVTAYGNSKDVYAWLGFHLFEWEDYEA